MNLYTEVRAALLASSPVAAIVGSGTSAKVWSRWPRTYSTPCIVMEVDGDEEQNDLLGQSDLMISDVTITCRADTSNGARSLWEAVRAVLLGYSGTFDAIIDSTADSQTPRGEGSEDQFCDRVMSCTMIWNP
jgi:hypothetical protein